jgi:hypothetical protein
VASSWRGRVNAATPFKETVTVLIAEPATGPLRAVAEASLECFVAARHAPAGAPGLDTALRPGESLYDYVARGIDRARYFLGQFSDGDEVIVTAPRSVLLAAIDSAMGAGHSPATLRALSDLYREIEAVKEDAS